MIKHFEEINNEINKAKEENKEILITTEYKLKNGIMSILFNYLSLLLFKISKEYLAIGNVDESEDELK